ncbi:4-(cytidine 5'-diphospho)-2-C-methyl-D-erythritol kinase [Mariprofundus micogutta]|uniref:4-(cytidine 5'-diphospho)-2-C-methyl-D-erythritol kinase n=1 Tax=Mariprofundus micogutta TaxID=1921010 RepID=UPI0009355AF0|nr:4-(cytidine 5'-diphospho)-2-C-methyl-D-erythritol kinase [Mariprofundus micogutta]
MIHLAAPAKINLHLYVTAIRPDGMHELDTSFAFTEASDLLSIERSELIQVGCSNEQLSGEKNLVFKILRAFKEQYAVEQGLSVFIEKNIPEQAGLGGGSSDAATALLAANKLWGIHASMDQLIAFATPFGADIPCFLFGQASIAHGIGEKLQEYPQKLPAKQLLLAWPGTGLSTAEVFHHFDQSVASGDHTLTSPKGVDTIRRDSGSLGENDLEGSACSLSPEVSQLLQHLRNHSEKAWMSGSGSTCVALFDDLRQANAMADTLKQLGLATWTHVGNIHSRHPLQAEHIGT